MIHQILSQIDHHWFQDIVDLIAALNIIAQGARVMGWSKLADELAKIEEAIQVMVNTALNRGTTTQGGQK